jgi:uncharacterized alkaline shock family protein YloU
MAQPAQSAGEKKAKRKKSSPITPVDDYISGPGVTTIAPEVLITIARLTTLDTPGVSRMNPVPGAVSRFRRGAADGIVLEIKNDSVIADLYVVVKNDVNMREVSRNIQHNVRRAISEMVGMQVGRVNIHIEDIEFTPV